MSTKTDFVWVSFTGSCFIKRGARHCICVSSDSLGVANSRYDSDLMLEELADYPGSYGVFFPVEALI